jgi:hypothetical protein
MKGRKRNGREGRREGRDIRGENGEEIGGTGWEDGWGEGCAHRYSGIDVPVRCHWKYIQQFFGTELIREQVQLSEISCQKHSESRILTFEHLRGGAEYLKS